MNDDEIAAFLTAMEVAWPRDRPHGWQRLWAAQMRDLPGRQAIPALDTLIRTKSFPPSIAEVREAIAREMGVLPAADGEALGLAWSEAWEFSEMTHGDRPYPWNDKSIERAVRSFGGPAVVMGDREGWAAFWRRWEASERARVLGSDLSQIAIES